MVSWSWSGIRLGLGVDSGSLVGHISDISVISVGDVLDVLDPAIGKSHGVSTLDIAGTIGGLLGVEVGLGVVISNGVGVGVGGDLIGVSLGLVGGGGGVVSGGSVGNNRGGVDGVSDDRGGVDSVSQDVGVGVGTYIRAGSHDGEESSSDESLKMSQCLEFFFE